MDLSLSIGNSASFIPFSLGSTQFDECGRYRVYQPRVQPTLLSLFPSAPADQLSAKRNSTQSVLWQETQQISDGECGTVVVNRREGELISWDIGGLALCSSTHRDSGYVQDESLQQTSLRTHQQDLSLQVTSRAPSLDFINLVPFQRTGRHVPSPSEDPSEISPTAKGQRSESDRELIFFGRTSPELCKWTAISATRNSYGQGSASSSRAADQNSPDVTPDSSAVTLDAQAAAGTLSNHGRRSPRPSHSGTPPRPNHSGRAISRHGPKPKSSPYRGVTHYKRTGRWEAHIWNKGKQLYLGASSTAEKAARAYDRAAIHFRGSRAELNCLKVDYIMELRQLMEISDEKIVKILRKQSAGEGTPHPDYPPVRPLRGAPRIFGA